MSAAVRREKKRRKGKIHMRRKTARERNTETNVQYRAVRNLQLNWECLFNANPNLRIKMKFLVMHFLILKTLSIKASAKRLYVNVFHF